MIELRQLHDTIQIKWNYAWIHCNIQYNPRNMHTVFALLCFVVVINWMIFLYPSGLLHWHCGNLTIAQVPAKQPWWIWINTSCEFIMNDCVTTTKQSTTKPYASFLGYTVAIWNHLMIWKYLQNFIFVTKFSSIFCYTVNIHLEKWLMRCDTKRAIWWELYNKHISIFCIKHMSTIFRTMWVNKMIVEEPNVFLLLRDKCY